MTLPYEWVYVKLQFIFPYVLLYLPIDKVGK